MAQAFQPPPQYYYLVFDNPEVFRIFYETDEIMATLTDVYAKFKVPEPMQERFISMDYDISLTQDKELIIQKKETPLSIFKEDILRQAYDYGNSDAVDANLINGMPIVLDISLRLKIRERILRAKEKGNTSDTLTFGNTQITLPLATIETLLGTIVDRAIANYEVLQKHIAQLSTLNDRNALATYNYKEGYIAPLTFNL